MFLLTALAAVAPIFGLRAVGIGASSALVTARAGPAQRIVGTVQIALTGVVGAVAAAFIWHLVFYATADRGFDAADVLVVEVERVPTTPQNLASVDGVVERERRREIVTGLPGVDAASFASYAPGGAGSIRLTMIQRESGDYAEYGTIYTDAYYTDVLDIPIAFGSRLDPNDRMQILGNESYARDRFGHADAAGEITTTGYTLQGVMMDAAFRHPAAAVMPMALSSWPQVHYPLLLVETRISPAELSSMLETRIDAGELDIAVRAITPLTLFIGRDLRDDRVRATLTAAAAGLVVTLAALGFYGMQRYLVTAGQREYAIRAALGAGPRALARLVMLRSAELALPGLVSGGLLALMVVLWLRDGFVTNGVSAGAVDLITLVAMVLLVVAATVGPALQAASMTPALLLREP